MRAVEIARALGRPEPTPEQVAVVEAPLEPMLVVAGAGSGKTETMASRVVWLIANGLVLPSEVLGLTFTRKAAAELSDRVAARLGQLGRVRGAGGEADPFDRPTVATYNAYAAALVKDHALRLGIEPDARLLTEASQWQLATEVVEAWSGDLDTDLAVSTIVGAVVALSAALDEHLLDPADARARLRGLIDEIAATPPPPKRPGHLADVAKLAGSLATRVRLLDVVEAYRRRKREADSIDFGDQIAIAARLAQGVPAVGAGERARFRVVLLDEYQDTSYAQIELLANLFGAGHCVTAVGDPNQSIYGWRGASAAGLARFPERFAVGGDPRRPAPVRYLRTSWRNDVAILAAANTTAGPLRRGSARVPVPELTTRPGAGPGRVRAEYLPSGQEEAAAVAEFVAERWRPADAAGRGRVTAAVLCRKRSQFPAMEAALRARGVPVEVVGLGGLLDTPEVVDVVAALEAAHDPSRGDSLMRLLTGPRVNLGAADLHALGSWAADLAREDPRAGEGATGGSPEASGAPPAGQASATRDASAATGSPGGTSDPPGAAALVEEDAVDHRSLADALESLPEPGQATRDGRRLTAEGLARLRALARLLRELRRSTHLSLPEMVATAERALGLDIEVVAAATLESIGRVPVGSGGRGRSHLDAFRDVASSFAQSADQPTLGAFLAWLGAAGARERGLDMPVQDVDPDAVQVATVHAAKGLEWDVVAVPGLVDDNFPDIATVREDGPRDRAWTTAVDELPYPLRGDAPDLPVLDLSGAEDGRELDDRRRAFLSAAGEHAVAEERRLAYVAFTRARRDLLVTGSWWREAATPRPPSPFLVELLAAGTATGGVADPPAAGEENPAVAQAPEGVWPAAGITPVRAMLTAAAERVREADGEPAEGVLADRDGTDLVRLATTLLAERDMRRDADPSVPLPEHLSASGLVRLARDRDAFALDLRRPIPAEPQTGASRGTRFHRWVERYYREPALFDPFDLDPWEQDDPVEADLAGLEEAFRASPWATLEPLALELPIETPIGGLVVRSRIDAVFADPERPATADDPGGVVVVDWKTGAPPADPEALRAREVQLAVYRLAWSRWAGLPLDRISAAFFYAGTGTTVRPRRLLDEAGIERLLHGPDGAVVSLPGRG